MKTLLLTLLLLPIFFASAYAQNLTTADQVLTTYFNAIGGREALLSIKDLTCKSVSTNNGVSFPTLTQYKPPLKQVITSSAPNGQVMFKLVCDGKGVSVAVGGNKSTLSRSAMDKMMLTM